MIETDVRESLRIATGLAEEAGRLALRWFRRPIAIDNKAGGGAFDPVTEADRAVESFLRAELSRRFPDDRIVGEEAGESGGPGPRRWVLDPIDGTRAFVSGSPLWGTMVGLDDGERAIGGIVCAPALGETYLGDRRHAWLRRHGQEAAIRARPRAALGESILYCTHPDTLGNAGARDAFGRLAARCRMHRYGGDCYSYCLLASGHVDLVVEGSLQPYDVVALVPIVEGAGGVITNWEGESPERGGLVVAAASRELHAAALAVLREAPLP